MKSHRVRHDLRYFTSLVLLILVPFTATSGLVSDLWDLNEFVIHKYTGYGLAILGLVHIYLNWNSLFSYLGWRIGRDSRRADLRSRVRRKRVVRQHAAPVVREKGKDDLAGDQEWWQGFTLSRRGFTRLMLGGLGGFALGYLLRPQPDLPAGEDLGSLYHAWSKPTLGSFLSTVSDWGKQPPLYKTYARAKHVNLHPPGDFRGLSTEEAIQRRRSVRDFGRERLTRKELSNFFYTTCGITDNRWGTKLRAAPSAGALYPIEIYPVIHRVQDLAPGLYHYAVREHALEQLQAGDLRGEIVRCGLGQEFLGEANLVLIFTAIFQRLRWKYQERSYRYALLEAGHIAQNGYLTATSMGMGACAVGAFIDDDLNELVGVDGRDEAAIYLLAVGKI